MQYAKEKFLNLELKPLSYLRKINIEAYAYAVKTDRLLAELKSNELKGN